MSMQIGNSMKYIYLILGMATIAQLIFFWTGAIKIHPLTFSAWGIYVAIDSIMCYYKRKRIDKIIKEVMKKLEKEQEDNNVQ